MDEIKIIPLEDIPKLIDLRNDTYPGYTSPSNREESIEKTKEFQTKNPFPFYGYYREGQLLGSMRLLDFTMNLYGQKRLVGGLASVSVNLLHKKEQIAKKMVQFFLQHYRKRGASFAFLYAFRPDFYKKMGFGYGTRTFDYNVNPLSFPRGKTKEHLTFLTKEDADLWIACHNRIVDKTHGMMEKTINEYKFYLDDPSKKFIGYMKDGEIKGYMIFSPKTVNEENRLITHFVIHEWIYESTEVLQEFMTFLRSQADQFERVAFQTQEEEFYYLLDDARYNTNRLIPTLFHESHRVGVGMMPHVINSEQAITEIHGRQFGMEDVTVQFRIVDDFLDEQSEVTVKFTHGAASLSTEKADVVIDIDIANYSSLLYGSVSFESLYKYGLVTLSEPSYADRLIAVFSKVDKPVCTLSF